MKIASAHSHWQKSHSHTLTKKDVSKCVQKTNLKKHRKLCRGRNNNIKGKDTSNQWQNAEVD